MPTPTVATPLNRSGFARALRFLPLVSLLVTALLTAVLLTQFSLQPEVRRDFFFAESDPPMQESIQLGKRFGSQAQVVVTARATDVASDDYLGRIQSLSEALLQQSAVLSVKSLSHGPKDYDDVLDSPLWRPLLLNSDGKSSNLIVLLAGDDQQAAVAGVEVVLAQYERDGFDLFMAGTPYVTEMLRRDLVQDFKRFSVLSLIVMGVIILLLFRSFAIVLGALVASIFAVVLTLMLQSLLGIPLGMLTANLTTIICVLVVSHVVFLSGNWRTAARQQTHLDDGALLGRAWRRTMRASFWCMLTTLLGFVTLIFVDAEPLRQLGIGGSLGTVAALLAAFLVFPVFLSWSKRPVPSPASANRNTVAIQPASNSVQTFWSKPLLPVSLTLLLLVAACGYALPKLDLDPDLFAYFEDGGEIEQGLAYIDRNGGSNPLTFSVRRQDGERLDKKANYQQLWALQDALLAHPSVGTIVSLPLIMAEADRHPLSFLFSWKKMLDKLQQEKYGKVADNFITADRSSAFFFLRMVEANQGEQSRLETVAELKAIVAKQGFAVELTGGVYYLQGELAELVKTSLWQGMLGLLLAFSLISLLITKNLRHAVALTLTAAAVPVVIFGLLAWLRIPLDVIAAPSANVAVGMAVDMMIHCALAAKLAGEAGKLSHWQAWAYARQQQWSSVLGASIIVIAGFAIFGFSDFPPTARFGLAVVIGTAAAAVLTTWLLPVLAGWRPSSKRNNKQKDNPDHRPMNSAAA